MQTITRHGGGSHYVRPDRVYRTGVLQSTMGYDPGADVQDVAASFTAYPMDLQAPGLSGLGFGATNLPFLQRLRLRYNAWRARRAAGMHGWHYTEGVRGLGLGPDGDARDYGVAYPQVGMQLSPAEVGKHDMAMELMNGGIPRGYARAQAGKSWDRWWNMRWNG